MAYLGWLITISLLVGCLWSLYQYRQASQKQLKEHLISAEMPLTEFEQAAYEFYGWVRAFQQASTDEEITKYMHKSSDAQTQLFDIAENLRFYKQMARSIKAQAAPSADSPLPAGVVSMSDFLDSRKPPQT